ncbi:Uma2 family endonuclease [Streptomyces sp. BE303]|uniref:Uma2 family endonuclease n=1 Tax=Streptomyces sp. BE303 TaxID=3002528 RepID=UPI002E78B651|nr:Uma2 family endonuclease [Streptomyces sp. BE303]MED7948364.1 Uma2 family endonuclease [Streptomyces sp. BE303]
MTPRSEEHFSTIKSIQIDSCALGRHVKGISDVCIDFPADENSAPDVVILREGAQRQGTRHVFEDVLLIAKVVSASSACKDYDDCTAKYGRYGIPVYVVVDPYAAEVVVHTQLTGSGYIAAHTRKYGSGKLPIELADGRNYTFDLDELPRPRQTPTDARHATSIYSRLEEPNSIRSFA